jgi:hypothetical protein
MPFDGTPLSEKNLRSRLPCHLLGVDIGSQTDRPAAAGALPNDLLGNRSRSATVSLRVLIRARELLAEKEHWCQRSIARGWFGIPVPANSAKARRYCALGALTRAGYELGLPFEGASVALQRQMGCLIPNWNDHSTRTHAEVLATFDATIDTLSPG